MWEKLFFDKYAGDRHYNNEITRKVDIDDLEDGSFNIYVNKDAYTLYTQQFPNASVISENILDLDMYRLLLYTKEEQGIDCVYTVLGVNTKKLESYVLNNTPIPEVDFLKKSIRFHMGYTNSFKLLTNINFYNSNSKKDKITNNCNYICEKASQSSDYTMDDRIKKVKDITAELYEYQKCSIKWMLEKERNLKKISYNLNEEALLGNVFYDLYRQNFYHISDRKELTFWGGGLIDEVGLGKTVQMITLAILNPTSDTSYLTEDKKKLKSRATIVFCPNQLCGQWKRELKNMISKEYDPNIVTMMTMLGGVEVQ